METDRFLAEKLVHKTYPNACGERLKDVWHPSTDISQCFEYVVPKMEDLGYYLCLNRNVLISQWVATWHKKRSGEKITVDFSTNPATAICEAARAALEGE